jgi:glycosyltransferase involved in cell wall biosynthesis
MYYKTDDWIDREIQKIQSLTPRVSVIIPTYNRAAYLREAIDSVLGQTFVDFELIVVDDGSTDNTKEVVASIEDSRIFYKYQENSGVAAARNTGITISKGEYIAFLDSDDVWLPHNLEIKVRSLDTHPAAGLVCSDAYILDSHFCHILGRRWHNRELHDWVDIKIAIKYPLQTMLRRGCFITPQACVMRRKVFNLTGYFDESLSTHEDWDLFIRIIQNFPIEILDTPLLKIRRHENSLSANWDKMYFGAINVLNKAISSQILSAEELYLIKRRLAYTHYSYGKSLILNGMTNTGRQKMVESLKIHPAQIRPYLFFITSLFGDRFIVLIKSLAKTTRNNAAVINQGITKLFIRASF